MTDGREGGGRARASPQPDRRGWGERRKRLACALCELTPVDSLPDRAPACPPAALVVGALHAGPTPPGHHWATSATSACSETWQR